ncbi:multifunctional CCA addition/repair protein [Aestuariibacter sp. AA17]|uniref:Multifunctional CCA protein n=1 Tax=Fluctibacter corallii TaxID=2984329 RepID=A0ABT3A7Z5_9ALTE|nr:multifunctional CCA addition/repair protein [Aestuariibacter sp. AA17]MCV2884811.1 multifunctional CCA addition/repair protein [Aestuariibacter sp. AA17]
MQTYLVGGAVRDTLLGRTVKDRDWVVVGTTEDEMLSKGYIRVGSDFPVFLHPDTREEHALARTERKQGRGYTGFECHADTDVTLEQDLLRRDLTINAIAQAPDGTLVDPYGGKADLEQRVLRHVSDAFIEDPLRVLRVARFAARYHQYGFTIHADTLALMKHMCEGGELNDLSAERVWQETAKSLLEDHPEVYFETLRACGGLRYWFPELDALWGVPNPAKWHPEIDTGVHTMMVLAQAVQLSDDIDVRFAALTHDLGKALTPPEKWPSHHGHEKAGLTAIDALCERLKVPNSAQHLARLTSEFHGHIHRAFELKPATLLKVFNQCDVWRRPERFSAMLTACKADARGRTGFEQDAYTQKEYVEQALAAANAIDVQAIIADGFSGKGIKDELDTRRIRAIAEVKSQRAA